MTEKNLCKRLRREFSTGGWALLIYYAIMNAAVTVALVVDIIVKVSLFGGSLTDALSAAAGNGCGYVAATVIGAVLLYLWKKREFCFKTIWKKEKSITVGAFFSIAAIFFGVQAVAQIMVLVMEWFFGLFGLSVMESLEAASTVEDTVSMFLYAAILAPVGEEILFRGLLLRILEPYGKKFSVLASAFLFGMFHGNIVQTPYAFLVGLVLGYVAIEYSVVWAIVLHMLNNMVLADFMTRLARILPPGVGDLISGFFIWGCAIAGAIILIVKRREIAEYVSARKIHPLCLKSFFTAPGVVVLSSVMILNILLAFLMQI